MTDQAGIRRLIKALRTWENHRGQGMGEHMLVLGIEAGKNPVDFSLSHSRDDENGQRISNVVKAVVEKSKYIEEMIDALAMGITASIEANSSAAHKAEVSIENARIKVYNLTCALDIEVAVNPDQVKAQCEDYVIMGMSGARPQKMTNRDGQLYPTIYES